MSEARDVPGSSNWLYDAFVRLGEKVDDQHRRNREHFDNRFDLLAAELKTHMRDDDAVATRVTKLEEERRYNQERRAAVELERNRRTTLIGALAGTFAMAMWKLIATWATSGGSR